MTLWHHGVAPVQWTVVIAASLVAAICDVATRRIPNRLTGPALLAGLVWAAWIGGWPGLADSAAACVLLAIPYVLLFVFAGGGAGDAKLMGAVGAWLGLVNGTAALVCVSITAVLLGLCFSLAKRQFRVVLSNIACAVLGALFWLCARGKLARGAAASPDIEGMTKMPYGVSILAGVCMAAGGVALWRVS